MPGFPALGTTAGARLSEKPAPIWSRRNIQACNGAGWGSRGTCLDGLAGEPSARPAQLFPKMPDRCLLLRGCSPALTLRGASCSPHRARGVLSPGGLGWFQPLVGLAEALQAGD